ncbi:Uncharacterised protein [Clostridioides difficile]|uniref:hypothetical protein n=1 Tax=Clostridioides difficile TaxID=1496 RepID=UPI00097FEFD8|nr:hypothetical protein [Clostridioides difficile]SJS94101.1 Uncharacterised protein [Clostridioides difficile]HBG8471214.1 hypothetical protein [Clostridioides difficile]
MINNKSEIINKLFFNELKILIDKYNNMDSKLIKIIETIFERIGNEDLLDYILKNNNKLLEIISVYKFEHGIDIDKIRLFIWVNMSIGDIAIEDTNEYYHKLMNNNYVEINEYIIYRNQESLREYARSELATMLDSEYHIDRLFDKEMIVDMWINDTSKEELIEEIVQNNDIEEILELQSEYAFTLNNNTDYIYSEINN